MKTLWIALSVFAALGVICCGGLFFYGKSIFDKTTALTADAKVFSNDFLQKSLKNGKSDPSKVVKASAGAIDVEIKTEEKALGKFLSIGPLTPTFRNYSRNDSESTFSVNLHTNAVFEKGAADLDLTVDRTDGIWLAKSIYFNAPPASASTVGK